MKHVVAGCMLLVVLNLGFSYAYLEPTLSVCKRKDPNLDKCIQDVVERIRPNVASGNYGSSNVLPKLEPVVIEKIRIERGNTFGANFSNLVIAGAGQFVIKKLKTNLDDRKINVSVILPSLDVKGKYSLNMNILVLRIAGKGDISATLNETKAILRLEYYTERVGDRDLTRFRPIDLKLKFDKARFYLTNLFNGDPTLERVGNDAINENPMVLLDEVKESFEQNLSEKFTEIANSLVKDADLDEIFPE
ncbi:hypothetical protein pipiens_015553 [Culex pipiens pipiens]|uniref:Hemolymph juvenile hormone binding protein n=1 Tax=Culex pipiens pipiens TaxID=38569 RepID=A0ABD1CQ07_CULPP